MAGIDYTIPGQIRPIQVESPMNAMAQAMQLRALQESSQMNALKQQEYQRGVEQKNALARIHADPKVKIGSPEYLALVSQQAPDLYEGVATRAYQQADLIEKTNKRKLDESALKNKITQEDLERSIAHITSFRDLPSIYADLDKRVASGELDPAQADQMRNTLPPDESGLLDWKRNLHLKLLNAKDRLEEDRKFAERTQPKPEKIEQNGQISFIDMNPNSPTYGRPTGPAEAITDKNPKWTARDIGGSITYVDENQNSPTFGQQKANTAITKTAAPAAIGESDLSRLQRERADIFKANESDPRLVQYDAAIAKATATNSPLSDLARKQDELEKLEAELVKDPNNVKLKQRVKEYKDDIRKDTQWKPSTVVVQAPTLTKDALDMAADQFLVTGTIPSVNRADRSAIINRAAAMAKEKGMSADVVDRMANKANQSALTQLTKQETMVGAFEKNFIKNVSIVERISQKKDNTGVPLLQKWINVGKKAASGDPELASLAVAIKAVQNEYGKIVSGSMGNTAVAVSEIKRMEELLNAAQTPQDVMAVLNTMREETQNRMAGFKEQKSELTNEIRRPTKGNVTTADPLGIRK
jgi:hypothetical protein